MLCEEDEEEEDASLIVESRSRQEMRTPRLPPRFPREAQRDYPGALRPPSPFDRRLKRLGQRIEEEVRKECSPSRQSQLEESDSAEECWNSSVLLSTADSFNSRASFIHGAAERSEETSVMFPGLEALEADCCQALVDDRVEDGPLFIRSSSNHSFSSGSLSPRDSPVHQYLFYEEEEDVVMEFLPTLNDIQQVC